MIEFQSKSLSLIPEEYCVYSDVLSQFFQIGYRPELFVIKDHTVSNIILEERNVKEMDKRFIEEIEGLRKIFNLRSEEIFFDFIIKNKKSYPLERRFHFSINYILISEKELSEIFKDFQRGWIEFYKRYPKARGAGIVEFSRVGFNFKEDQALVEICAVQDYLMGQGFLILLEKKKDNWTIQEKKRTWIS